MREVTQWVTKRKTNNSGKIETLLLKKEVAAGISKIKYLLVPPYLPLTKTHHISLNVDVSKVPEKHARVQVDVHAQASTHAHIHTNIRLRNFLFYVVKSWLTAQDVRFSSI